MESKMTELEVEGMTCTNCAVSVQKYLEKIGAEEVSVNFATKEVRFRNSPGIPFERIRDGIHSLGYEVITARQQGGLTPLEKRLIIASAFTLPLLLHMLLPFPILHDPWFQLILSIPVAYIGVAFFGRSAFQSIRNGTANMDVLIFTGSMAAFVYSIAGMIIHYGTPHVHRFLFFETGASIITLVLLGNYIEERSVQRTTTALKELNALQKEKARVLRMRGHEEEWVETEQAELVAGDIVLANTGDKVVADGPVVKGEAGLDESVVTGESSPVYKEKGQTVLSGTLVVDGSIRYQVERAGQQSTLSKIIGMVKDAQGRKPRIQRLGDRVSAVFVPAVVIIAVLTFLLSYFVFGLEAQAAMLSSVAVLVISCPCAMGLATPTAIMVGVGQGARNGILIKGGDSIEKLARVKTVVFDKTGTITTGKFTVRNFETWLFDETVAKNIVLHMEQASSHPIARSIVETYRDWFMMKFEYRMLREISGLGIHAEDASGNTFDLGSPAFVAPGQEQFAHKDVLLSYCGKVVAGFDIQDELKPGVREAVAQLHGMGIRTVMLSGDSEKKCAYAAQRSGIREFHHSRKPEQKLEHIRLLSKEGTTAMVGDGINDAPALSAADLGISLGHATDIARQSAEVIISAGQIGKVAGALILGRKTYRTIRQNLFWALLYNVVAIPVAAAGLLDPMVAALSMAFSDVVVVGNSLRLNFSKF